MDKQNEALKKIQNNELEKAAALFIEYTEENPQDPVGYINVGNILQQTNQIKEAERFYLKAIELDKDAATAYYGLGNLYYGEKMYDHAEKMFSHCLTLGLEESDVYFLLGMTYMLRDQMMLCLPFLQRATEIERKEEYLFQYGLALAKMHYAEEASQIFHDLLSINETHADALYNLGILAFHATNFDDALDYLNRALQQQPDHSLARKAKQTVEQMQQRDE